MCMGGSPKIPEEKKPDPIVTDEDENSGKGVMRSRDRSKIAALYGPDSMRKTGATGLPGGAATAGKTSTGA